MATSNRLRMIEEMLAETPNDPELRYAQAMEHASLGDDEAAIRNFQAMFAMAPEYAPAYHQCGLALTRLGRDDQARTVLQQGIAVARRHGNDHAAEEMVALFDSLGD